MNWHTISAAPAPADYYAELQPRSYIAIAALLIQQDRDTGHTRAVASVFHGAELIPADTLTGFVRIVDQYNVAPNPSTFGGELH